MKKSKLFYKIKLLTILIPVKLVEMQSGLNVSSVFFKY